MKTDIQRYRAAEQRLWAAAGAAPAERRVRLAQIGVEIRVQEVGDGDPVLFIHGGPNAGSKWAPLAARLPGHRCLLVDRPGTGLSDPLPRPWGVQELRSFADQFVPDVLDALGIDRADVVASSLGGFIALRSAAANPERVDRMVQLGCPALVPGMQTPPFLRLATSPVLGRLARRLPASRWSNRAAMRQMGHGATIDAGAMPPAYEDWYLALQRHTDTVANDGRLIATAATRRGFDARLALDAGDLAAVRAPTRFVWGADDGFGGAEVAERVVEAMPTAELTMLPACGHLPWLDRPEQVAELTRAWLAAPALARPMRTVS